MVPKDILVDDGTPIHIDKRGFRGPGISTVKPPGTTRIVFLGGSHVFDYLGGSWPMMAGDELRGRGREIEVISAGVPGHGSTDSLAKLLTDIWGLAPDIVFFCQAWNGIKSFTRLSPALPYRGRPPEEPVS